MRVSKSFAESLMDAVMQGRVPGMQFKRNWDILANMGQTWDAITNIVGDHLNSVRAAAHDQGMQSARDYSLQRDKWLAKNARTAERKRIIAKLRHLIATMIYVSELEDFANELEAECE